jgi:hypothetical protein
MEVCMNPIETRGGSIGWDPKVERAFDGILQILELLECFEDYYEQCKKEGRKVFD